MPKKQSSKKQLSFQNDKEDDYPTYKEYLDQFITSQDLRYLRKKDAIHRLIQLGFRNTARVLTRQEYDEMIAAKRLEATINPASDQLKYALKNLKPDIVLKELAYRVKLNFEKKISTIVFLMSRRTDGFEVSSYIDFEYSLRKSIAMTEDSQDWPAVFEGRKLLRPSPNDLSYYDWHRKHITHNDTDNYTVMHDPKEGLTFQHRGDLKKIIIRDPMSVNFKRYTLYSEMYGYFVIFDHIIRKKN